MPRLQFCVSGSAIESASKHTYLADTDSIWKLETQNFILAIFLNQASLHVFFKFDPTLTSHNSDLKKFSNKNHHIFRKPWTSAFRWHTLDTSETLPEAQRTQGIESITQTIPTAEWKRNTIIYLSYINLCVVNVKCMIIISDHSFNIFCNSCTVAPCRPHCNAMHWWPHSPHWASPYQPGFASYWHHQ